MKCTFCERENGPGGAHIGINETAGTCVSCGRAICLRHSHAPNQADARKLICPNCAGRPAAVEPAPRH